VLVFTSRHAPGFRAAALEAAGAEVIAVPDGGDGQGLALDAVVEELGRHGVTSVLLEGGAGMFASALEAGVVTRLALFVAPKLLGGRESRPLLDGLPGTSIEGAIRVEEMSCRRIGEDLLVEGRPVGPGRRTD
jgi:diaminohydroxyphosphoribosylaminopyrimidine deaminase/5-amino-6-(5-phosphoribosylamino)uracil reductase